MGKAGGPIFFEEGAANQLVYRGGLALAALVDLALRNPSLRVDGRTGDLDELMRALTNDPRWSLDGRAPGLKAFGQPLERSLEPFELTLQANLESPRLLTLDPGSLTHQLGLRPGDRVRRINGIPIGTEAGLRKAWGQLGETLLVSVQRAGESLEWQQKLPQQVRYSLPLDAWKP